MRRHLNTLYVTTEGGWLRKDGENIVMELESKEVGRVPLHMLDGVICIGRAMLSPSLMGHCAQLGVTITFLTAHGRFLARVEGPVSGNVLLRREQYRCSDDETKCAGLIRHILVGKLANQRTVIRRALRDHGPGMPEDGRAILETTQQRLATMARALLREDQTQDQLRGCEGEAARSYFSVFDRLIRVDEPALRFGGRNRRPPLDPINALLSFLYTLLTHDCRSALESVGLDPAVGFLHRPRPGRASLALDLAEEFRPFFADRLALSLINRRQLARKDFQVRDGGAVVMRDDARKVVLTAYQERKRETLRHPFLEETVEIGLLPWLQAQLLARHLRGDLDAYPAFLWK